MLKPTPAERFFAKVNKTDSCWLWTGAKHVFGYGAFKVRSYTVVRAHRWSYEYHVGPIPEGLTIDHLCRVPACVRPDHLEPVTQGENNRRIPRPTHCPAGHAFTPENTSVRTTNARGWTSRKCLTCDRERNATYRAEIAEGARSVERRAFETLKSHCVNGHAFTDENTYVAPNVRRDCRECVRARTRAYQLRRSAAA